MRLAAAVAGDLAASTAVTSLLSGFVFRQLSNVRPSWRQVAAGSLVAAVLFKLGQYL